MFLRCQRRKKDGKVHEYWSVVENRRLADGRVAQRQVLYLGEINASQREAWRKTIEVCDQGQRRQVALFPAGSMPCDDVDAVGVCLSQLRLERPRQWGACWLALQLWQQLELDNFWRPRLRPPRAATPWLKVLKTLVAYRLIDPGSEWRLHRQWFDSSAMADLLESDFALAEKNTLYRCLDRLTEHKDELFKFLLRRWGELFGAQFDVLLYDLTSTYFEGLCEAIPKAKHGYNRDGRSECRQRGPHQCRQSYPTRSQAGPVGRWQTCQSRRPCLQSRPHQNQLFPDCRRSPARPRAAPPVRRQASRARRSCRIRACDIRRPRHG
jgi:hypothetical protein